MVQLLLPRLVGTREAVADLMDDQELPDTFDGADLIVRAADLVTGSTSFADELVKEAFVRRATGVVVEGAPRRFSDHVRVAAERQGVAKKVCFKTHDDVPVQTSA